MKAKLIKIENNESHPLISQIESQIVFEVEPKYFGYSYLYVSQIKVPLTGYETFIFPCDENGEVFDWGQLHGSVGGRYITPEDLIRELGYEVVK